MTLQTTFKEDWLEKLLDLKSKHFTGQFFIKSRETFWHFQLSFGWIFYATKGSTQNWKRRLLLYCPELEEKQLMSKFLSQSAEPSSCWEYHFLFGLVDSKEVTKTQAEQIILLGILEALYEVLYVFDQVEESYQSKSPLSDPPLLQFAPEKLLAEVRGLAQIWQVAKMPGSSFKLAFVLKQPEKVRWQQQSSALFYSKYLDGRHTLWDIAAKVQHQATAVAQELIPNILSSAIELIEVSDLPFSLAPQPASVPSEALVLREDFAAIEKHESGHANNSTPRPLKKNPPRNIRTLLGVGLLGVCFLSPLLIGGSFWLWKLQSSKSTAVAVPPIPASPASTPAPPSDIQLYKSMRDVPKVPKGVFNLGGALLFAPLRSPKVLSAIARAQPQFHLRYVDPVFDHPGSHKGVSMLLNNELAFSQNDLSLDDSEYSRAKERGFTLQEVPVGIDAVTFFIHPDLEIPGLSVDQLQDIYLGKITNWNQVGGPNLPIVPITIDPKDSSTIAILMQNIPGGVSSVRRVQIVRDYTASIRQVSATPGGISFGSVGTVKGQQSIQPLAIAKVGSNQYINPYTSDDQINAQAIRDSSYPLTRSIFVDIRKDGTPNEQAGIAYANLLLSNEGQRLVEQAGFVALH